MNYINGNIIIGELEYTVVEVKDHLADIMTSISGAVSDYMHGKAIALDFSLLRKRGARTSSSSGVSTGAASFAIAFDNAITPIISAVDTHRHMPVAILKEGHPDFQEFSNAKTISITFIARSDDHKKIYIPEPIELEGAEGLKPRWKLTKEELKKDLEKLERYADPMARE